MKGKKLNRTFLITGSTDGIGLNTAKCLAKTAPAATRKKDKRVIAIHGRNPDRIERAISEIIKCSKDNKQNYIIKSFCYDLSDYE